MTAKDLKIREILSIITCILLLIGTIFTGLFIHIPSVGANTLDHNVGNVQVKMLTDYGRILQSINWGGSQTVKDPAGFGFIGLVIDHDGYNHVPGAEDIADSFGSYPYVSADDLQTVGNITMVIDDGTTQKSIASFQNEGAGTNDPYDILVNQTAWTYKNKDWVILQWTLTNIRTPAAALTGVCMGIEMPFSKDGGRFGVGGGIADGGDDVDGYDAVNNIYWVRDTDSGTTFGVGSAIESDPITHYYAQDYHSDYSSEYKNFFSDDSWLYNRLHAPNACATDGVNPGNVTTTLGWNGFSLNPLESRTFSLVFAINSSQGNMLNAIFDAQNYYNTVVSGFRIAEFSDFGSLPQKIEVYNYGNQPTDMTAGGYFLSVDGGATQLTGTWDTIPIPTYGYGVFTVTGGAIGPEGDTIGLYQDKGGGNVDLKDIVSFGIEGAAYDPAIGESASRRFDVPSGTYMNEWVKNASSGPTWGAQNNVPSIEQAPSLIINEVMFNPGSPELGFIELMYIESGTLNVQGFRINCDGEYVIPPSQVLDPANPYFTITQADDPAFFANIDSSGDNIYLYDANGILFDMAGWSSSHLQKMSMSRIPDGNGTYSGYNDVSSASAGWVFNTPLDVIVTEIADSDSATSQIEVYNPIYPPIDFSSGFSLGSTSSGTLTGIWSTPVAPTNGYAVFDVATPGGLDPEGDDLRFFQSGVLIEELSYGYLGVLPDPQALGSAARIWDGAIPGYSNGWSKNISGGPTWGTQNTAAQLDPFSEVVLNEVLFNPGIPELGYIELMYNGGTSIDIQNYRIICDDEIIILGSTILSANDKYFIFQHVDDPAFFSNMDPTGDNVYLYDSAGSLLDMVGWSGLHLVNSSMVRMPEGLGGRFGFDDTSSQTQGWVFDQIPTPPFVNVEPDQFQIGIQGMTLSYKLNITNKNNLDDVLDISFSSIKGWAVELFQADGITPLSDSESGPDADGIPDTGVVVAKSMVQITVNVSIPFGVVGGISEYTTIFATSSINSFAKDSALLNTSTLKGLEYRSPNRYVTFVRGTLMVIGHLDNTQVKLTDISSGALLNQFTINYGETWTTTLTDVHVDINATNNVTVLSGNSIYAAGGNSWMSYIPTQSGGKYGRSFYGFVPTELYIFAPRTGSLPATSISIIDESDGDDTQTLTSANCDFSNSDIEIYKLTSFDDDIVTISSNVHISVLGGKVSDGVDWTATPPSVNGSELGKHYFVFASEAVTIFPLEDNTNVTISDLSDGDDSKSIKLNRFDMYTQRSLSEFGNPIVTRPGSTLYHNSNNLIDDDYLEIISDKEILVYLGPVCDQRQEFADLSPSVSTGFFSQEVFTFAQNGGANDLQVFVYDKEHTIVKITSLTYSWAPGSGRDTFFDFTLDSDDFLGLGPWWWEWGGWGGNILHIQANLPISVFNGDFDGASFGSFLSVINPPENLIYPDLKIDSADISFFPSPVINNGEAVNIKATVHNVGDLNVTDVKVSFYSGNPLTGGTLCASNQTIPYLDVGNNITLNITWLPPSAGTYEIFIAIDFPSPGFILEFDETNNLASKILTVQAILPPELYITASGDNISLNWTQPKTAGLSHYLIYRSTSQVEFDFSSPWVDTQGILANGVDPVDGLINPTRTTWNDTGAASEFAEWEYYYNMQAVFGSGEISYTSRTVGKYTKTFSQGISTFSLPLEPIMVHDIEYYCQDMSADHIKWMDPTNHNWMRHDRGSPVNITQMETGRGYEIYFDQKTKYTFCGLPGAMILYSNISFGFNAAPGGEAQNLSAYVNNVSDTVVLNWGQPESMGSGDQYHVLRATQRDGFWGAQGVDYQQIATLPNNTLFYLDNVTATQGTEYYYMIVPVNQSTGERGTGSYSIGVCTLGFSQYDSFALPLKPANYHNADWFCDNIDDAVGINYFNLSLQIWFWHSTLMPEGAFDANIEFGLGYQISTSFATKFHFVGI